MIVTLNHYCLNYIFQFLTPNDWCSFAQVCKAWKHAAYSRDFRKLEYVGRIYKRDKADQIFEKDPCYSYNYVRSVNLMNNLQLTDCCKILKLVAPKLKYVKIHYKNNGIEYPQSQYTSVYVAFGRFQYVMKIKYEDEKKLTKALVNHTEGVVKLKIDSFDNATTLEWEKFFQSNPHLNHVQYRPEYEYDSGEHNQTNFINHLLPLFPSKLEKIGLILRYQLLDGEQEKIVQFLQRLPRLSKIHLEFPESIFSPAIATEIAKHAKTIKKLCLEHRSDKKIFWRNAKIDDTKTLSIIPQLINLTKLTLAGFYFHPNVCTQIAENCQSIHKLKLDKFNFISGTRLQALMSLPILNELHITPNMNLIPKKEIQLQKLVFGRPGVSFDPDNLADAIALMPKLKSLTWCYSENPCTASYRRVNPSDSMKEVIFSRGQNIHLYSVKLNPITEKHEIDEKTDVMMSETVTSNDEFQILTGHF